MRKRSILGIAALSAITAGAAVTQLLPEPKADGTKPTGANAENLKLGFLSAEHYLVTKNNDGSNALITAFNKNSADAVGRLIKPNTPEWQEMENKRQSKTDVAVVVQYQDFWWALQYDSPGNMFILPIRKEKPDFDRLASVAMQSNKRYVIESAPDEIEKAKIDKLLKIFPNKEALSARPIDP
jgi:hypothetical protein